MIDFSEARFEDPRWWMRTRLILDSLDSEVLLEHSHLLHRHFLALVGSESEPNVRAEYTKICEECLTATTKKLFPWIDFAGQEKRDKDQLVEAYNQNVGNLQDPAYKREVDLLVQELAQRRLTTIREAAQRDEQERKKGGMMDKAKKRRKRG